MNKWPYTKPAITCAEQVNLLRSRGMTVEDPAEAEFYLQHLNYYRLGAYWLPFEEDHATHRFKPGTDFKQVLNLYIFDRELRLLVLDALERLEVSVRTQWAYHLGHRHGTHAQLEPLIAFRQDRWKSNLESLEKEIRRSDEVFIRHLTSTYSEPLPPVWAVCEVMSLGLLSRWYANLKPMATRTAIASVYGLDQRVFESWLHHLTLVRNVCAHHSRLWNREFSVTPMLPQKPSTLATQFQPRSRKVYNALLMLMHCMDRIAPRHHWRRRLLSLIDQHAIPVASIGAPADWKSQPLWQEVAP
jgi:abortive infection bacteriophage resistance protein